MKYRLSISQEAGEALRHLSLLTADGKTVDIKEVKPKRSLPQNALLHVLIGGFAAHFGYSEIEGKALYKRLPGNRDIYMTRFSDKGVQFEYERSSAELNKEEMTRSIETLREWSAKMGYPLPTAEDQDWLRRLENYAEENGRYL